jgi:maleate cis-trans isomerase
MKKQSLEEYYTLGKQKLIYLTPYYLDIVKDIAKDFNNNGSKAIRHCLKFYYDNKDFFKMVTQKDLNFLKELFEEIEDIKKYEKTMSSEAIY